MDCDFKGTDYDQYKFFPSLLKEVDCRDARQAVHSYMFGKMDLNNDMTIDQCELTYGCIGSQKFEDPGQCVEMAQEVGNYTFVDVVKNCAQQYKDLYCPAIDGIPFADGDKKVDALKDTAFLTDEQAEGIAGLLPKGVRLEKAFVAKEDGWGHADFHNIVDGKGPTLTIIKNTVGYVFGGYTDISWENSGGPKTGKGNSFQFFFKNHTTGEAVKIPHKANGMGEVYFRSDLLTSFQDGIWIYHDCNVNTMSNSVFTGGQYEWPEGTDSEWSAALAVTGINDRSWAKFQCSDIETFFVIEE